MKQLLILILVFSGKYLFSQELKTILQSSKWFAVTKGKTIIYSKKSADKKPVSYEFNELGKVIHCGETTEVFFDVNGNELAETTYRCDSISTYEVKNNMLKTRLLKQAPDYYKVLVKGEILELNPVSAEEYNK